MCESATQVGFLGLGAMGLPMASRLVLAGYTVTGFDLQPARCEQFAKSGGHLAKTPAEAARGAEFVVTMLPNASIVADALTGIEGAVANLGPSSLVVEMSSSAPLQTRALGERLAAQGIAVIDAPVSGGVSRAEQGTLAIMAGGRAEDIERARPVLSAMGNSIFPTGPLGSGHAMKALNNYVSASGLVAACEALIVGKAFGLAPETIVDVLNSSTGRNNSTETKLKQFVLSETFGSGFAMSLMAKDLKTAAELAGQLGVEAVEITQAAALWEDAAKVSGIADHTAIYLYLAKGRD